MDGVLQRIRPDSWAKAAVSWKCFDETWNLGSTIRILPSDLRHARIWWKNNLGLGTSWTIQKARMKSTGVSTPRLFGSLLWRRIMLERPFLSARFCIASNIFGWISAAMTQPLSPTSLARPMEKNPIPQPTSKTVMPFDTYEPNIFSGLSKKCRKRLSNVYANHHGQIWPPIQRAFHNNFRSLGKFQYIIIAYILGYQFWASLLFFLTRLLPSFLLIANKSPWQLERHHELALFQ